jgi:hypothetical protein
MEVARIGSAIARAAVGEAEVSTASVVDPWIGANSLPFVLSHNVAPRLLWARSLTLERGSVHERASSTKGPPMKRHLSALRATLVLAALACAACSGASPEETNDEDAELTGSAPAVALTDDGTKIQANMTSSAYSKVFTMQAFAQQNADVSISASFEPYVLVILPDGRKFRPGTKPTDVSVWNHNGYNAYWSNEYQDSTTVPIVKDGTLKVIVTSQANMDAKAHKAPPVTTGQFSIGGEVFEI